MKNHPVGLALSGLVLASGVAVDSGRSVLQGLGPSTPIEGWVVIQAGVLLASCLLLVRLGGILRDWKRAIDKAVTFGATIAKVNVRLDRVEAEQAATQARVSELHADLHRRLGGTPPGREQRGA